MTSLCSCIHLTFHVSKDGELKCFLVVYFCISMTFSWFNIPYSIERKKKTRKNLVSPFLSFAYLNLFLFPAVTMVTFAILVYFTKISFYSFLQCERWDKKIFHSQLLAATGNKPIFERWRNN